MFSKRISEKKQAELDAEFCVRMELRCGSKFLSTEQGSTDEAYWRQEMARWRLLKEALKEKNEQRTTK